MTAPRVVVSGAAGRMGRLAVESLDAAPDLRLVGTLTRDDDPDALLDPARCDVLLDFTVAPVSVALALLAAGRGICPVVGTSGWNDAQRTSLAQACAQAGVGGLLIPNFSLGAVLQMDAAARIARYMPCTGIVETHHAGKRDAPSGTARATARRIARASPSGTAPAIESRREANAQAQQDIGFALEHERLVLQHAVSDRRAYMPGVLLAVRRVRDLDGLVVGLESLLAEPAG